MNIYDKLLYQAADIITQIRMGNQISDNRISVLKNLYFIEDSLDKIKRDIIGYYEEEILNYDDILTESAYENLLKYYSEKSVKNPDIINKLIAQAKKNKFRKYELKDTLLSISELEKLL